MFRWLLILSIFIISLNALDNNAILKRADGYMKNGAKTNQFRAYNDYKNLYLRALMAEDEKLMIRSLEGIVKSGEILHIDVDDYKSKLLQLKPKKKIKVKKQAIGKVKKVKKTKETKKKKIKVQSSHKLQKITWNEDKLILKFDKRLLSKQVNYFTLYSPKTKRYKYVFDVHASMLKKSYNLQKSGINKIRLAQYNPKTLRLVIENSKKIKIKFYKKSNQLIITVASTAKKTKTSKNKAINKKTISSPKRVDRDKVIVIDAGHGGKDPGAVGYKRYREKVVVLQIAKELKSILKTRGYKVYMTRHSDRFIKLSRRTAYANKKNADIFISIHANAVGRRNAKKVHGVETYFLSKSRSKRASRVAEKENSADMSDMNRYGKNTFLNFLNHHKILASNKLAIDLQRGMLGSLNKKYKNVRDGGVREGPFWVLVGAQMPAVLVEIGFISHPTEAKRLVNKRYQKQMARGLANGVERYFLNN